MDFAIGAITGLNKISNAIGALCLRPVAMLPGWLSISLISAVMGVVLLIIFKFTSNQKAIAIIRDNIKANMLAIKLFNCGFTVALKAQVGIIANAFKLLFHSIVPMIIMIVPVSLFLGQMAMWYQVRPVSLTDDPIIVRLKLNDNFEQWSNVSLKTRPSELSILGQVRIFSRNEIIWKLKPLINGDHVLTFKVADQIVDKKMSVGHGFQRLSAMRPGPSLSEILLYPLESPFERHSNIQSIFIDYPKRKSYVYGTDWWILYFCVVSIIIALIVKPFLKVRI